MIGWKQYERLASPKRSFSEAWEDFSREFSPAKLKIDPDEVFGGVRDKDPGRDSGL